MLFSAPICLPEKNEVFLGKFGWAAGWGALNPGSRLRPKTLQAVDVPVIENKVCERWHRANGINVVIYPEMLCAGYRNGIRIDKWHEGDSKLFFSGSFDSSCSVLTFFHFFFKLWYASLSLPRRQGWVFLFNALILMIYLLFLFIHTSSEYPFLRLIHH